MLFARDASPAPELNARQRWAVVALDVAMVAELTVAVYAASRCPDDFTPVFMKVFFSLLIPTLIAGFWGIRRLRDRAGDVGTSGRAAA